jgi:AmmeMemoRadiSam system protein B
LLLLALAPGDHATASSACPANCSPFAPLYQDAETFSAAIKQADVTSQGWGAISGITVPHHLVATDLIASAFGLVEGRSIDKVIVLFPDHFRKTHSPFASTKRPFDTVFGLVRTQVSNVSRLLAEGDLVEESDLFEKDHGIGAILPFLKHALPDAAIVPIAVSVSSNRAEWDRLVAILASLVTPGTLIVQSTDFSHYLPFGEAIRRDQQTLNLIAAGDLEKLEQLSQPYNLDSRGAQYIQLRLQREYFQADPLVLFNANQQAYTDVPETRTTSYIVQVFARSATGRVMPDVPGSQMYCFAGDTFFGRGVASVLSRPEIAARVRDSINEILNGCRLVLNLEGVALERIPLGIGAEKLAMPAALALHWLRAMNVVAVSLANNHARDLGEDALAAMTRGLRQAGLTVVRDGEEADLGPFRLLALTDLNNSREPPSGLITSTAIEAIARSAARPPLFAFLHWGTEYDPKPGRREHEVAEALQEAVVGLIVGAHPHVAATRLELLADGRSLMAFSLGNFLFDQSSPRVSGAILEVRIFKQGTFFARLIPIPNFYEEALRSERTGDCLSGEPQSGEAGTHNHGLGVMESDSRPCGPRPE